MPSEADTCRKFVVLKLQAAGWDNEPYSIAEQRTITDGRIFAGFRGSRQIQERVFGQIRGATRPGYNTALPGNVELPVPPLDKQRRIVAELDELLAEVDALKRLQAETAAELDALLSAILDRAFKGKL